MTLVIVAAPPGEPLDLGEAKRHLREVGTDKDDDISALISDSREYAESILWRTLVIRTLDLVLDRFPAVIVPPSPPLRTVESITYVDGAGSTQTLAASKYQVDLGAEPGRIKPAWGETWPGTRQVFNAVTVRHKAGIVTPFTVNDTTDVITAKGHPYADDDVLRLSHSGAEGEALPAGLAANTDYYARDVVAGVSLKVAATSGGVAIDITDTGAGTHYLGGLPKPVRRAMLLNIGAWFENRESIIVGQTAAAMPGVAAADALLFSQRNHLG